MKSDNSTGGSSLYVQGRGALRRELVACLRTGRALREPRARSRNTPQGHVGADVVISARPAEAADRAVPGHWEGDLIIGTGRSAIGTLVERASRSTILVHLPRLEGWGDSPPIKNGPSLGGYGAVAMNTALTASMTKLPAQLRRTLTWDRGKELAGHAQLTLATGAKVFFADPHSPWQRPTNENTNGLLRQYFPKGTDLSRWTAEDLEAVALALNNRPRKTLGWRTPAEVFDDHLRSLQQPGVATTPKPNGSAQRHDIPLVVPVASQPNRGAVLTKCSQHGVVRSAHLPAAQPHPAQPDRASGGPTFDEANRQAPRS